jgi:zinc protease
MMRLSVRILFFFISAIFVFEVPAWAEPGVPFETKLKNGLTVIIEEEHSAPVVAVEMWVKVGGADETENEAGLSHVFEHMLFKGTQKKKVGEIAKIIESVGGNINAFTSLDNTVFHLAVPSRNFSAGLDIISDAIQHSSFDPGELKKELEVVLEEMRMNEDEPGRKLYKTLLANAYSEHPYKRPVIGYQSVIENLKRDELITFFKKWYIPSNMTLVIVGDVNKDAALKEIDEAFRDFKNAPDPHKKRPVEPVQKEFKVGIINQPIKESHLAIGFHIPELKSPDIYAIDVMANILGSGESSRLYKRLKIQDSLVHTISAYAMTPRDPGLFMLSANLESKNVDKTVSETLEEIKRLGFDGPNPEELQKAKLNLESDFVYSRETMQGIAQKLGYYKTNAGGLGFEKKYLEGLRKVTDQDIRRVINRYFFPEGMTVAVVAPIADKDLVTRAGIIKAAAAAKEKVGKEFTEEKNTPEITRVKLENGITLIVKEAHSNPTVAFYAAFPGGLRVEDEKTDGVGNLTAGMLTRGTSKMSRGDISRELDEMAGELNGFSGWNSAGVQGKFLSMYFDKGLGLFADVLTAPSFSEREIADLKKDVIAAIARQEDNLPSYTFKLLYKALYKAHPYGMPALGTPETVKSFTRDDLVRRYQNVFVPERMVLTIVGDVKRDYAIARVKELFKDFKGNAAPLPGPPIEVKQAEIRTTGAVKTKEQTNIGMGFLGTSIGSEDSYPLRVMTEVLSGQGGRLFIDLRDKRSLAYSVTAFSREGVDPGLFAVYVGCAPSKKDEAIAGILKELTAIRTEKVTDQELARAKGALIGSYEIGLQQVSSQAADMTNNELYGLGYGFSKVFPDRIGAVTADDILRVARKYLTLDAYSISVVGPNAEK